MKTPRFFLCEGLDPVRGQIRTLLRCAGFSSAKTRFFLQHGIPAIHISLLNL
jgi:hypothetical protein